MSNDLGNNVMPTTPLFCSNRGTRVSYDALHYRWAQVCKASRGAERTATKARRSP